MKELARYLLQAGAELRDEAAPLPTLRLPRLRSRPGQPDWVRERLQIRVHSGVVCLRNSLG